MQTITKTCDFCPDGVSHEVTSEIRIGDKMYDSCNSCRRAMEGLLKDKGREIFTVVSNPLPWPAVFPPPQVPFNPTYPGTAPVYIGDPIQPPIQPNVTICGNIQQGQATCGTAR
jgi:hypothetical protein